MALQDVSIPRAGGNIGGIFAFPDVEGTFPGVVMIPTVRGLDEFAHSVVQRLAGDGFAALGVNIFDHPGVPEDVFKRPGALPDDLTLGDLEAALQFLTDHPRVNGQPVCAWGYCIGGRFSLLWATYQPKLAAAAAFHGFPTNDTTNPNTPTEAAGRVALQTVPVIGCFGEGDRLVPMSEVARYRGALEKHGKDFEIHTYAGADHGWTNPKAPAYIEQAAEDCWDSARRFVTRRIAAQVPAR